MDNAFRPVIVPECSTEDAAFYPLSAAAPKLRATGAANAVEVSRLLRIAHKGVLAGLDACKLGRLSTALYADEPCCSTDQVQRRVLPLAAPQLGSCTSSGRAWWLWAARHSQE